jgi:hypothetical protein
MIYIEKTLRALKRPKAARTVAAETMVRPSSSAISRASSRLFSVGRTLRSA